MASDSDSSDGDIKNSQESTPAKSGRKNIRKVLKDKQVAEDTKLAAKEEEERLKRIAERQALVYFVIPLVILVVILSVLLLLLIVYI